MRNALQGRGLPRGRQAKKNLNRSWSVGLRLGESDEVMGFEIL